MRILQVHNYYQQAGGEDAVFESEVSLLKRYGHSVFTYSIHNQKVRELSKGKLAVAAVWNREATQSITSLIKAHQIEVVHVHNTLPLISPAVFHAAKKAGAAVVRTLHNYRHSCAAGTFFREGSVCELCTNKTFAYPAIQHACYRSSRAATSVAVLSQAIHHRLGTYTQKIDQYIALSDFTREKAIAGGLPASRIAVKPNFLFEDPGMKDGRPERHALYVGRLSPEKGIELMLKTFEETNVPLKIVGDGPLRKQVEAVCSRCDSIEYLGRKAHPDLIDEMKAASFVVVPSIWHEPFGLVAIEAFACGTPVISSCIGSLRDIVQNNVTGLHFEAGVLRDFKNKVMWADSHPKEMEQMGIQGRQAFENKYTAQTNYELLMNIYEQAIQKSKQQAVG